MQRFFVRNEQLKENKTIEILGKDVNHIKNVLRCKIKERIEVCILETGIAYLCEIEEITGEYILVSVIEQIKKTKEANIYINVIQGLPKADKMELIIQKCTELGVAEFTPLSLKRCIVKIDKKDEVKKVSRWQKLAETAAKQCGRNIIPKVNNIYNIQNIYEILKEYDIVLVAYENEKDNMLKTVLNKNQNKKDIKIAIIIGPEGGLEENEIQLLNENKCNIISLGNRILRTETVAFVMTSIIMYELGDLGGEI